MKAMPRAVRATYYSDGAGGRSVPCAPVCLRSGYAVSAASLCSARLCASAVSDQACTGEGGRCRSSGSPQALRTTDILLRESSRFRADLLPGSRPGSVLDRRAAWPGRKVYGSPCAHAHACALSDAMLAHACRHVPSLLSATTRNSMHGALPASVRCALPGPPAKVKAPPVCGPAPAWTHRPNGPFPR